MQACEQALLCNLTHVKCAEAFDMQCGMFMKMTQATNKNEITQRINTSLMLKKERKLSGHAEVTTVVVLEANITRNKRDTTVAPNTIVFRIKPGFARAPNSVTARSL